MRFIKKSTVVMLIALQLSVFMCGRETDLSKTNQKRIAPIIPNDTVNVVNSKDLVVDHLSVERIPIGIDDDYKPCIVFLPNGNLLLCFFHQVQFPDKKVREDMFFCRSHDGGKTWSVREKMDLLGREPYFSVCNDSTLYITTHLLENDIRNTDGVTHSYIHRSGDEGKTWSTTKITSAELPGAPKGTWVITSRNVLQLTDGTHIVGVSTLKGYDFLWRSSNRGITWDKMLSCKFENVEKEKLWWPFWAETFLWETKSGELLGLWRVDHRVFPMPGRIVPESESDQYERMIVFRSKDNGKLWTREEELGSEYGEMYPNIIRLRNRRLLLTFTVRANKTPLGVRAVLGVETNNGFTIDFMHDRVILDEKTPANVSSGGGFGPTVQLSNDILVTSYSYRSKDNKTHVEIVRWQLP